MIILARAPVRGHVLALRAGATGRGGHLRSRLAGRLALSLALVLRQVQPIRDPDDGLHGHVSARDTHAIGRQHDTLEATQRAVLWDVFQATGVHCRLAPLAAHASQTLDAIAGLFAPETLAPDLGQVALAPVVLLAHVLEALVGHVCGAFATVAYAEFLALEVDAVLADGAAGRTRLVLDPFPADIAELALRVRLGPTVGHRVLDGARGNC